MANTKQTPVAINDRQQESSAIIQVIERAASNPDVDINKMERLLDMQERMLAKLAETDFNNAMNLAQSEMERVSADARNPQTHSDYATYAALDKALRPIYVKHGFALSFGTGKAKHPDMVRVICWISHVGGHCTRRHVDMPADGKGAKGGDVMTKTHAVGSGISYGMRYLLKMIFNVAIGDDDDDGNAAGGANLLEELLAYNEKVREHFDTIFYVKDFLIPKWGDNESSRNISAAREAFKELDEADQRVLWRAPTKGGIFTTEERRMMKEPPEGSI